ncbi:glycosyltransferase family 2 protein [Amylibacter sp.]|nr:glycosyltransferase family 2 protein [Amylibacter sp.]MDB4095669.1 glycosyltransferase family 2 protein [Amylibacter sp.]
MKVQLIIPMSGLGTRFVNQGYTDLKPLIKIHNKPMIAWVLRMFPDAISPLFICRKDHLKNTKMLDILEENCSDGVVIGIEGKKLGPVGALISAFKHINDNDPVIVSYCDYYMKWDYLSFLKLVKNQGYDGAIPCYSGFHPHLLPANNLYASCRTNSKGELLEIREKFSFNSDKTKSLHSPGLYYFKSGRLLKKYCEKLVESGDSLGGEYYVSLVYKMMLQDNLRIGVPVNVKQFCQWGTPYDLEEYLYWTNHIIGKN